MNQALGSPWRRLALTLQDDHRAGCHLPQASLRDKGPREAVSAQCQLWEHTATHFS